MRCRLALSAVLLALACAGPAVAEEPDLIFRKSTVWKFLTPDDKLAVYGIDDPVVEGVACHFTTPEKGGVSGMFGVADEVSDISLACRQVGPITFKGKFEQATWFSARAGRCSSRRCRSCAAAMPSAMCWFTWSIQTS